MSGLAAAAPASNPAWNLRMSGVSTPPMNPTVPVVLFSAAATPIRNEPCSSEKSRHLTFGISTTVKVSSWGQSSVMANRVSGNSVPTRHTFWAKAKPLAMISSMPDSARRRRFSSRFSPPASGASSSPVTPYSARALSQAEAARSLNDRSPRPPTSKAMPTVRPVPSGATAAVVVVSPAADVVVSPPAVVVGSAAAVVVASPAVVVVSPPSSPPQAASTSARAEIRARYRK